ncbi:MAG: hypothetical protein OEW05_03175, partial [Candidatus Aminicenantes bacterium]|nr:hypothetical protein [Candidatus Aminicenantes bacterium]
AGNDLIVATHGRGLFIADVSFLAEITPEVLAKDVHLFGIESKMRWTATDRRDSSSSNYSGQSEPLGIVVNYYLKAKPKTEVKLQVYKGNLLLNEIKGTDTPGLNAVQWTMTGRRERTAEEAKQAQEQMRRIREMGFTGAGDIGNFASFPVPDGEYRFVLVIDGKSYLGFASILPEANN